MSKTITAKVVSTNLSKEKGKIKHPAKNITINSNGILNDAHAGTTNRQISLLGIESVKKFEAYAKRSVKHGEFAENITTQGICLYKTSVLDRIIVGNTILEVSQIGKKCYGEVCAIYREVGKCIMPKEGIFCRVIKGGVVKAGDKITHQPKIYSALIITLSDRASKKTYKDKSGPALISHMEAYFKEANKPFTIEHQIIPDDAKKLESLLLKAKKQKIDFIITTGGTGISERDITPDVIKPLLDKEIPGIMEMIRYKYGIKNTNALLSRSVAGVIGKSLIYALPGSVRAVEEYMSDITPTLSHTLFMLHGIDAH